MTFDTEVPLAAIFRATSSGEAIDPIRRTTFAALKIGETSHLQKWVLANPEVLGEELLVITREYDGFDKSRKRLDILALDQGGKLVVVELKLTTAGHFADLQGINYGAMVSTMTMADVLRLYAKHHHVTEGEAGENVQAFLGAEHDGLPELDDQPRIIIAAGSFGGHEITSTALWLRTFGVDIKLVEIAPYAASSTEFILVPRVVIPIPEAEKYMVGHERKENAQRISRSRENSREYAGFLKEVHERAMRSSLRATLGDERPKSRYFSFPALPGKRRNDHHYEWVFDSKGFTVGLHFERTGDGPWNGRMLEWFETRLDEIEPINGQRPEVLRSGPTWYWLGYSLAPGIKDVELSDELAEEAVAMMEHLYSQTAQRLPEAVSYADRLEGSGFDPG